MSSYRVEYHAGNNWKTYNDRLSQVQAYAIAQEATGHSEMYGSGWQFRVLHRPTGRVVWPRKDGENANL